jgi:hypothetical protein
MGSLRGGEFLDWLIDYQVLMEGYAPWSQYMVLISDR